ncbi:hypothetical protein ACGFI9_01475 [Micromonospora sp. NPDC048930]|uniref:hypothetical protein n=1 Tax=Micromonospora sp. NPDC048930 TaxID=3364261 RepID=UPI0037244D87
MSRPDRWWRPTTQRRPPLRARQRRMYTEQEMTATFDTGYECGQGDERKRHDQQDEWLRRVLDAYDAGPDAVTALAQEVGVMPADAADQLVDELERWLRGQGDG